MKDTFYTPLSATGIMKVVKVTKSNQRFTYVNELECTLAEKWLAANNISIAPSRRYPTKDMYSLNLNDINDAEELEYVQITNPYIV